MKILYKKSFHKKLLKLPKTIQKKAEWALIVLQGDPYNPQLNRHKLKGKMKQYESINITGDYRIIFHETQKGIEILCIDIGSHSELY